MTMKQVEEWRRARPDFSDYVLHFTTERPPIGIAEERNQGYKHLGPISKLSAYDRLVSIISSKRIQATPMPWTNSLAVAFTECPWGSLLQHAEVYSPYGIGFKKETLYAANGGPAIYLRQELKTAQEKYVQRLDPKAQPFPREFYAVHNTLPALLCQEEEGMRVVDYTHEREWRVPNECVVVNTYQDEAKFPREYKDAIGREKFLIMDNYRSIQELWPAQ
jgi:hypothetical protein